MPRKSSKATDNEETTPMTTADAPEVTLGVSAPTRSRNGAGRQRADNPFDPIMGDLYESGEWAGVPFTDEDQRTTYQNQLKNSAQYHGYGLDMGVDENEPGVLKFHVRDKVQGRGRKPGSKKIDGHFYAPDELDADGNPLPDVRAAKESAE